VLEAYPSLAANRSQFYRDLPEGPFYGFNRPGVKASEAIIANWWRQGMIGGAKAHYDGIVALALLASGQINMRKVDGWQTLATKPIDQPIDLTA
jgi:hypothetical protein